MPRLQSCCDAAWFARGNILCGNILDSDVAADLARARRVLVFWDAHGPEVAEWVLSGVMPRLADLPHVILMHDLAHAVYDYCGDRFYGTKHLWNGECATPDHFRIGHIESAVTQAILALDFTGRNGIELHAAAESMHREFQEDPERWAELNRLLGGDMVQLYCNWFWFSLNESTGEPTFPMPRPRPKVVPAAEPAAVEPAGGPLSSRVFRLGRRLAGAIKRKLRRVA